MIEPYQGPVPEPRFLHVPRTGGTALAAHWALRPPEYLGHDAAQPGEGLRYGVVRNPYERILSLYLMFRPGSDAESFRTWVREGCQALNGHPNHVTFPAHFWLRRADYVMHYERLAWRLDRLSEILGREPMDVRPSTPLHLPHWYDKATQEHVQRIYALDFQRYGYTLSIPVG